MDGFIACSLESETVDSVCNKDERSLLQLLVALLQCSNVIFNALYSETNVHQTVNHSRSCDDPEAGYHTKNVERT